MMGKYLHRYLVFIFLGLGAMLVYAQTADPFPVPDGMEAQVAFWVDVYSQYSLDQRIIHDRDKPERIYSVLNVRDYYPAGYVSYKMAMALANQEKHRIGDLLTRLGSGSVASEVMTDEMKRLQALFTPDGGSEEIRRAAKRIHVQRGARESFLEGLVRSCQYSEAMKRIFRIQGLPEALISLAHVESSYNPYARSEAGAVGIWQFTRMGGAKYFMMNKDVDQRKDPLMSTVAAARELESLYAHLGSWPLAITAYNIGRYGMERASRRTQTQDLSVIVRKYRHPYFGYSARNFYTSFLAAVHVANQPEQYFKDYQPAPPLQFRTQRTLRSVSLDTLASALMLDVQVLVSLNPALSEQVRKSQRPVPPNYGLHVPTGERAGADETSLFEPVQQARTAVSDKTEQWLDENGSVISVPLMADQDELMGDMDWPCWSESRYRVGEARQQVMVYPEETLGHFAQWLDVPASRLRQVNSLRFGQKIKAGQWLLLDFSNVTRDVFEAARIAYHQFVWHDFFTERKIQAWQKETVRRGESLWTLAGRFPQVPYWLLWAANASKNLQKLQPGQEVSVPVVISAPVSDAL